VTDSPSAVPPAAPTSLVNEAGPRRGSLPRGLVILLGAAATVVVFAGIQATAWLIGPAFMALIVVIAVAPVQGCLRRHGWPGWATSLVVLVLVYNRAAEVRVCGRRSGQRPDREFIGDAVGLSVTITFVALVFWAWLLGPLGAILAIPLTLLAKGMLVDVDPLARWADAWLRASAKEPDPAAPTKGKSRPHRTGHAQPAVEPT
jgi:hypothetical protein